MIKLNVGGSMGLLLKRNQDSTQSKNGAGVKKQVKVSEKEAKGSPPRKPFAPTTGSPLAGSPPRKPFAPTTGSPLLRRRNTLMKNFELLASREQTNDSESEDEETRYVISTVN